MLWFIKVSEHPSSQHPLRDNAVQDYAVEKRSDSLMSNCSVLDPELHCYDVGSVKSKPLTVHLKSCEYPET